MSPEREPVYEAVPPALHATSALTGIVQGDD